MRSFNYVRGAAISVVAAGPVFALALVASASPGQLPSFAELGSPAIALPFILLLSVIWGVLIATIPVLAGGLAMAWLGNRFTVIRRPSIWALAGAATAMPLPLPFGYFSIPELLLPFAVTGAICALIVRYGTGWDDESV